MFCCNSEQFKAQHHKIKGILFLIFSIILIIVGILWIEGKIKENKYIGQGYSNKNTITVSGTGKISIKPDLAVVSISVVSQSKLVVEAQADNTEKMNNITSFLKDELKILDKDIKTTGYNIYPEYNYTKDGVRYFIGYKITQTLGVKIRDLAKVGDVLGGATELGANEINSLTFTIEDLEKAKVDARKLAIENAKEKAKTLSSQIGVGLGKIISFNEDYYNTVPTPMYSTKEAYGLGGSGSVPDVQTGENEVSVNVSLTYELR